MEINFFDLNQSWTGTTGATRLKQEKYNKRVQHFLNLCTEFEIKSPDIHPLLRLVFTRHRKTLKAIRCITRQSLWNRLS